MWPLHTILLLFYPSAFTWNSVLTLSAARTEVGHKEFLWRTKFISGDVLCNVYGPPVIRMTTDSTKRQQETKMCILWNPVTQSYRSISPMFSRSRYFTRWAVHISAFDFGSGLRTQNQIRTYLLNTIYRGYSVRSFLFREEIRSDQIVSRSHEDMANNEVQNGRKKTFQIITQSTILWIPFTKIDDVFFSLLYSVYSLSNNQ